MIQLRMDYSQINVKPRRCHRVNRLFQQGDYDRYIYIILALRSQTFAQSGSSWRSIKFLMTIFATTSDFVNLLLAMRTYES